jgi:O-antigen/teichoic acid export membrane protein
MTVHKKSVIAPLTIRKQVLSAIKWTAGAKFSGQMITWGITIFVMRLLSPEDYGLQAMASVFFAFLLMMAEVGLGPALVQKQDVDEIKLRQALGIVIVVNVGLLVALNLLAPAIAEFFKDERLLPILRVLSLQFPILAMSFIPDVLLQRKLDFKSRSLIDLSTAVSGSVLTIILAFAHYGVWALVFGNIFACILRTVIINVVAPFLRFPIFSWHGMRDLLSFGGNVFITRLLWFFFTQADVLIVGKLLGKEMLGLYSVAMHLASLPTQRVSAILNQVTFPVLSRFKNDDIRLGGYFLKAIRTLSFFAFPTLWGISCTANEIILLFLGPAWKGSILPLQLLSLVMPLGLLANFFPSAIDALGRPDVGLKNVLVASFVMPIAFLIASHWGIIGIAVAWITAYPVVLIINMQCMLRVMKLRLSDFFRAIAPAAISGVGMYLSVWGGSWLLANNIGQLNKLLVMIGIGMLVYGALSLLINRQGCGEVYGLIRKK